MKILLSTDGSEFSDVAIKFCYNIVAEPKNTSIKILSAIERPAPMVAEPFAVSTDYFNDIEQILREQARILTEKAKAEVTLLFPNGLLDLTADVVIGSPQRVIVEMAQEWQADLIIVGSHGYGFWNRTMLGSVSNSVLHHAPCSVLVVRKPDDLHDK